ncbi:hypothetical protein AAC387_Pa05g0042 [Persea americana]
MASMAFSPTETRIKPYLPPTLWMPELTALAMSRLLPFLPILLLILLSPSCEVGGFEEGGPRHPSPFHKMNVRDLMVLEHIMRDYPPGGANDKHEPNKPPHSL